MREGTGVNTTASAPSPNMGRRLFFPLVLVFWVVMNVLLWRSEMSSGSGSGSPIPPETVWRKILTAPDDSQLQILVDRQNIGSVRWVPSITEIRPPPSGRVGDTDNGEIEGRVTRVSGYAIDAEGNLRLPNVAQYLRFSYRATFTTNLEWRTMLLRVTLRPINWEIKADSVAGTLDVKLDEAGVVDQRHILFSDLQAHPEALLADLGGGAKVPWLALLPSLDLAPRSGRLNFSLLPLLSARQDWLRMGHTPVRVDRLEARFLDKYRFALLTSRVGELLKVDLPGGVVLLNDALQAF